MLSRDLQRILKMRDYCLRIQKTVTRFGDDLDTYCADIDFQQSVAFCLLRIGELASGLSEEYREATEDQMQWHMIRGLRNVIAHDYGKVQLDQVWKSICVNIPALRAFCNEQLPQEYRQDK